MIKDIFKNNIHTIMTFTAISLLAAIIITGAAEVSSFKKESDAIVSFIDSIESEVKLMQLARAAVIMEDLKSVWTSNENKWAMLIDHFEIDNIDTSLLRAEQYIRQEETGLAIAELAALRQYFRHIPEKESFLLKNIL